MGGRRPVSAAAGRRAHSREANTAKPPCLARPRTDLHVAVQAAHLGQHVALPRRQLREARLFQHPPQEGVGVKVGGVEGGGVARRGGQRGRQRAGGAGAGRRAAGGAGVEGRRAVGRL